MALETRLPYRLQDAEVVKKVRFVLQMHQNDLTLFPIHLFLTEQINFSKPNF